MHFLERAKAFWADEDVDQVFDRVLVYLKHLKRALEKNTATDKGWTFNLNSWLTSLVVFPIVMFVLFVNQSSFMA